MIGDTGITITVHDNQLEADYLISGDVLCQRTSELLRISARIGRRHCDPWNRGQKND